MPADFHSLYDRLSQWADQARDAGWLDARSVDALYRVEQARPGDLFEGQTYRPLIVAFFGGTGVGKSSLLNRLAGEGIAQVGVERPTSHEVTLYLHKDFQMGTLPAGLPLDATRIAHHSSPERRLVAWLDLPDFDSTEQANRAKVQAWLPFVDWVIYVVSPDRYHDDLGWRFLQARGQRHAWLFVMNHWDQGNEQQLGDFRRRLVEEGFSNPTILRTNAADANSRDDFPRLEETIHAAIRGYGLDVLQQLGVQARLDELARQAEQMGRHIGDTAAWATAEKAWQERIESGLTHLESHSRLNLDTLAQTRLAETSSALQWPWSRAPQAVSPALDADQLVEGIWTTRSEEYLTDLHTGLVNEVGAGGLPTVPVQRTLDSLGPRLNGPVKSALQWELSKALAQPGTRLQRFFHRLAGALMWLLPAIAALWAATYAVLGFYRGTQGQGAFLGLDFAIHSVLLMGLGWLLPWMARNRLKPSLAAAARRGLAEGISASGEALAAEHAGAWSTLRKQRDDVVAELDDIRMALQQVGSESLRKLSGASGLVSAPKSVR